MNLLDIYVASKYLLFSEMVSLHPKFTLRILAIFSSTIYILYKSLDVDCRMSCGIMYIYKTWYLEKLVCLLCKFIVFGYRGWL